MIEAFLGAFSELQWVFEGAFFHPPWLHSPLPKRHVRSVQIAGRDRKGPHRLVQTNHGNNDKHGKQRNVFKSADA